MTVETLEAESEPPDPEVPPDTENLEDRIRIPLTLASRCDGPGLEARYPGRIAYCGAQAYVRVTLASGQLLFCKHHYEQFESLFAASGYEIEDERQQLDKPKTEEAK